MDVAPDSADARRFGRYTLIAKLATGGMAEIFLARLAGDGGFEKLVCIKRILPHLARDPQFIVMFLDEARTAARISHPNVCQVFELGEWNKQYFIAMEYLEGVPLTCFRRGDYYPYRPDPRLVAGFIMQACEGLHHAHQLRRPDGASLGLVHRDISPQNLFVTLDGIVKVLDFGIAKATDASAKTSTGAVKGTYAYMAPEQLRNETLDRRTDVWALGAVLWELLAQRPLFKRETEFLTFQAIASEPIPDIADVRPDVPVLLADTLARALSRDREHRFASARALGEAIGQAVGPLGGAFAAAAIGDEVQRAFATTVAEQQSILRIAREGGHFDLDAESPLVGHGTQIATTPVSSLRRRLEGAQAEVARYAAVHDVLNDLDEGETSSSGFTPPPGLRPYAPAQVPQEASSPYAVAPAAWRDPFVSRPGSTPATPQTIVTVPPPAEKRGSKLPWIVAVAAVGCAGAAGTLLYLQHEQAQPSPTTTAPPAEAPVIAMHVEPQPPLPPLPQPQLQLKPLPPPPPPSLPPPPKPKPKAPPAATPEPSPAHVAGPPGFITIDSAPVYATIYVDGKNLGETPLVHISLGAGKHNVRAVSPSGTSKSLTITIDSGKTAPTRRIEW